jgi:predicted ester cyclase
LAEFENLHQKHWLHAFPDRAVQDLDCLFAEGAYTGGAGWNGVLATHTGRYLDCPATGKRIGVNGLDFWRREGDRFTENWVFVDMLHLFRQFGVDLLTRTAG